MQTGAPMRTRRGNDDDEMAPHGVYPVAGDDQWIAIAIVDDAQWRALAAEMRRGDLADLDAAARRARAAELDELIGQWTAIQNGPGLTHRLQAHGVPAHVVQNSGGCIDDPQLAHRDHFQWVPHEFAGRALVDGMPYTLSDAHNGFDWAGPTYGEHFMEVLTDILGYDTDRITELVVAGVLE